MMDTKRCLALGSSLAVLIACALSLSVGCSGDHDQRSARSKREAAPADASQSDSRLPQRAESAKLALSGTAAWSLPPYAGELARLKDLKVATDRLDRMIVGGHVANGINRYTLLLLTEGPNRRLYKVDLQDVTAAPSIAMNASGDTVIAWGTSLDPDPARVVFVPGADLETYFKGGGADPKPWKFARRSTDAMQVRITNAGDALVAVKRMKSSQDPDGSWLVAYDRKLAAWRGIEPALTEEVADFQLSAPYGADPTYDDELLMTWRDENFKLMGAWIRDGALGQNFLVGGDLNRTTGARYSEFANATTTSFLDPDTGEALIVFDRTGVDGAFIPSSIRIPRGSRAAPVASKVPGLPAGVLRTKVAAAYGSVFLSGQTSDGAWGTTTYTAGRGWDGIWRPVGVASKTSSVLPGHDGTPMLFACEVTPSSGGLSNMSWRQYVLRGGIWTLTWTVNRSDYLKDRPDDCGTFATPIGRVATDQVAELWMAPPQSGSVAGGKATVGMNFLGDRPTLSVTPMQGIRPASNFVERLDDQFRFVAEGDALDLVPIGWKLYRGSFEGRRSGSNALRTIGPVSAADNIAVQAYTRYADVSLRARLAIARAGTFAGIVGRLDASTNSYYLANAVKTSAGYEIALYKAISGSYTLLAARAVGKTVGGGEFFDLRFDLRNDSLRIYFNDGLAVDAKDNALTFGAFGFRSYGLDAEFASFQTFEAEPLTTTLPVSQSWSGAADSATPTAPWFVRTGGFAVRNESLVPDTSGLNLAEVIGLRAGDVSVSTRLELKAPGTYAGVMARYDPQSDSYYLAQVNEVGDRYNLSLYRRSAGSYTLLRSQLIPTGVFTLRLDVIDKHISVYVDGDLRLTAVDGGLASGSVGLRAHYGAVAFSDFRATPPPSKIGALPLDTTRGGDAASASDLGSAWTVKFGSFANVAGGWSGGDQDDNVAVLNGISVTDAAISAHIAPMREAYYAGLVLRAQGDGSHYLAQLEARPAPYLAIYRNTGGRWYLLGESPIGAGERYLSFVARGPHLSASIDGALKVQVTDATYARGTLGIRAFQASAVFRELKAEAIKTLPVELPFAQHWESAQAGARRGPVWIVKSGDFTVGATALTASGTVAENSAYVRTVAGPVVSVRATVELTGGAYAGVFAQLQPESGNMYIAQTHEYAGNRYVTLYKSFAGNWYLLGVKQIAKGPVSLRLAIDGTSLKVFAHDTVEPAIAYYDAWPLTAGYAGIRSFPANARFQDFVVE